VKEEFVIQFAFRCLPPDEMAEPEEQVMEH
jgi:hypothetical protein